MAFRISLFLPLFLILMLENSIGDKQQQFCDIWSSFKRNLGSDEQMDRRKKIVIENCEIAFCLGVKIIRIDT